MANRPRHITSIILFIAFVLSDAGRIKYKTKLVPIFKKSNNEKLCSRLKACYCKALIHNVQNCILVLTHILHCYISAVLIGAATTGGRYFFPKHIALLNFISLHFPLFEFFNYSGYLVPSSPILFTLPSSNTPFEFFATFFKEII
jgi:hypothetical protein